MQTISPNSHYVLWHRISLQGTDILTLNGTRVPMHKYRGLKILNAFIVKATSPSRETFKWLELV